MTDLKSALGTCAEQVVVTLQDLIAETDRAEAQVIDAMRYAVLNGGKRLRPFLTVQAAALFGVNEPQALRVGAAIEMIHSYSLVHDDLPAMDDDDLRRGKPTTHKKYDEATAILAGDALLTMAFQVLGEEVTHPSAEVRAELVTGLAVAAGAHGMVGGQMIDLLSENKSLDETQLKNLHALKTGRLISFSCVAGAIAGQAAPDERAALQAYGDHIGLAFQIADDVLDATQPSDVLGKTAGKDEASGKSTFVSLFGVEASREKANAEVAAAKECLSKYGSEADLLRAVADFIVSRSS